MAETMFDYIAAKPNTPDMSASIEASQNASMWEGIQKTGNALAKGATVVIEDMNAKAIKAAKEAQIKQDGIDSVVGAVQGKQDALLYQSALEGKTLDEKVKAREETLNTTVTDYTEGRGRDKYYIKAYTAELLSTQDSERKLLDVEHRTIVKGTVGQAAGDSTNPIQVIKKSVETQVINSQEAVEVYPNAMAIHVKNVASKTLGFLSNNSLSFEDAQKTEATLSTDVDNIKTLHATSYPGEQDSPAMKEATNALLKQTDELVTQVHTAMMTKAHQVIADAKGSQLSISTAYVSDVPVAALTYLHKGNPDALATAITDFQKSKYEMDLARSALRGSTLPPHQQDIVDKNDLYKQERGAGIQEKLMSYVKNENFPAIVALMSEGKAEASHITKVITEGLQHEVSQYQLTSNPQEKALHASKVNDTYSILHKVMSTPGGYQGLAEGEGGKLAADEYLTTIAVAQFGTGGSYVAAIDKVQEYQKKGDINLRKETFEKLSEINTGPERDAIERAIKVLAVTHTTTVNDDNIEKLYKSMTASTYKVDDVTVAGISSSGVKVVNAEVVAGLKKAIPGLAHVDVRGDVVTMFSDTGGIAGTMNIKELTKLQQEFNNDAFAAKAGAGISGVDKFTLGLTIFSGGASNVIDKHTTNIGQMVNTVSSRLYGHVKEGWINDSIFLKNTFGIDPTTPNNKIKIVNSLRAMSQVYNTTGEMPTGMTLVQQSQWKAMQQGNVTKSHLYSSMAAAYEKAHGINSIKVKGAASTEIDLYSNNPFNIRPPTGTKFQGQQGIIKGTGFGKFDTPENGIRAGLVNIGTNIKKYNPTIKTFIEKYAPASDNNDVKAYISAVSKEMGLNKDTYLNEGHVYSLGRALIRHEKTPKSAEFFLKHYDESYKYYLKTK